MIASAKQLDLRAKMEVSEYKKLYMPGRRPCINTMKNWIDSGQIDGCKIGTTYFVYIDAAAPEIKVKKSEDPVVNAYFDLAIEKLGK